MLRDRRPGLVGGRWLAAGMSVAQLHRPDRVVDVVSAARSAVRVAAEVPASFVERGRADRRDRRASRRWRRSWVPAAVAARGGRPAQGRAVAGSDRDGCVGGAADRVRTGRRWPAWCGWRGCWRRRYDATREAFAAGAINQAQVRVIVRAAEQLPGAVTDEHRRAAEAGLVAKAVRGMDAKRLRQAGRRMLERRPPRSPGEAAGSPTSTRPRCWPRRSDAPRSRPG